MTGPDFAKKIKDAITTVEACDYPIYFRTVTKSGAGNMLGIPDSIVNTDVLITPRPAMSFLTFEEVQGSAGLFQMGDRKFIMSNTQTTTDLNTKHIVYNSQVFRILKYESPMFDGQIVAHMVYARAM